MKITEVERVAAEKPLKRLKLILWLAISLVIVLAVIIIKNILVHYGYDDETFNFKTVYHLSCFFATIFAALIIIWSDKNRYLEDMLIRTRIVVDEEDEYTKKHSWYDEIKKDWGELTIDRVLTSNKYLCVNLILGSENGRPDKEVLESFIANSSITVNETSSTGALVLSGKSIVVIQVSLPKSVACDKTLVFKLLNGKTRSVDNPYFINGKLFSENRVMWQHKGKPEDKGILISMKENSCFLPGVVYKFDLLRNNELISALKGFISKNDPDLLILELNGLKIQNTNNMVVRSNWNKSVKIDLPEPTDLYVWRKSTKRAH
ncbi:MAG: hypothetical protein ACI88L_000208 [Candidatus Paceibacteria bacterium]|jgi:hypothetical protein